MQWSHGCCPVHFLLLDLQPACQGVGYTTAIKLPDGKVMWIYILITGDASLATHRRRLSLRGCASPLLPETHPLWTYNCIFSRI